MQQEFLTPEQAAQLKGVSRAAIYAAIAEGRLPSARILGRLGVKKADVLAWTPRGYGKRPSVQGAARPRGPLSEETKARISAAQKRRWARRKYNA